MSVELCIKSIVVTESMVVVNRTTSTPNAVLRYVVDKGLNFILEFSIHRSLISQMKVGRDLKKKKKKKNNNNNNNLLLVL